MAFTKEQRLLVLMAIACMGLAVVSAGCVDNDEVAVASRDILKNKTEDLVKQWCDCVKVGRNNSEGDFDYENDCFGTSVRVYKFYNKTVSFVNCSDLTEFRTLINPNALCEGFKIETPTTPTSTNAPTTPPTTAPDTSTTSNGTTTSPPTDATTSNGTTTSPPTDASTTSNGTTTSPPTDATKSTSSTTPNPTSEPETGPTHLYWLIPLILIIVAAMFGLGCYLHRRTKGSRGFHHSTKTNGSTKATNGEA